MSKYFKPMTLLHPAVNPIISFINTALEGNGSLTITASKKGISLRLGRTPFVKGKTPDELVSNIEALKASRSNLPTPRR